MLKSYNRNKVLLVIILLGAVLRILFLTYGAEYFFNRENIFIDGDTLGWQVSFENLVKRGTFYFGNPSGFCSRMPGYSFFIGIFYLITDDWEETSIIVGYTQTFLDIVCIYIFYRINTLLFNDKIALLAALLYSTYPFIIVWNPVNYSEQFSTFLLLLGCFIFFKAYFKNSFIQLFFSGIIFVAAALTRPQIIPIFGICMVFLLVKYYNSPRKLIIKTLVFIFSISTFLVWPIRNYINHDKFILTKNSDGFKDYDIDVISFMQYIYSIQTDWEPQYSQIKQNKKVTFPTLAYNNYEDSLKLEKVIYLLKNCGSGISRHPGYWKTPVIDDNCNAEIKDIFIELRNAQIKNNPINFYLTVPLKNLQKAIFKSILYNREGNVKFCSFLLFFYRSCLIISGLIGLIISFYNRNYSSAIIPFLYFIAVYFTLCFGTSPFMRNIEVRYFLQADILLLPTAAVALKEIYNRIKSFNYSIRIIN